jgi:P27 family predicted phage terminase small subunit
MSKSKARTTAPKPPAHLSDEAAKIWREVCAHLEQNGHLLRVDVGTIETYCMAVVRQRRLNAELDKAPLLDASGKPHPLLRTVEATAATVKNLAHVLGLNPVARRTLPAKQSTIAKGGTWDGILDQ